ncbi:protein kinase domain-containing protein [Nannocystis bainbridge]|uniref:Protein kinase n=1 Tax=Nannocystis bainbridge TaxID=2995303 RepID=A0ABT5EBG2_9BACT|nr:protein kinase [Nannocystis bainbridge]MDC0723209.1 protein kinase [Nannocystis bainbridge]
MDSPLTPRSGPRPTWPIYKEVGADFIGELLDGRYKIVRRLAKGGMAHVFLAKDLTRKCYVAIKLLRACSPEAHRRFAVEAEILSNIQHENIVRAIAFGHTADEQPYIALEHLDGETSSQRLSLGPLPWREVAEIGMQIADALHSLHRVGVIHRDVKPDNIILTTGADRCVAKLIDLGLASVGVPFHEAQDARFTPPVIRHKTQLGRAIGTPDYLPPEAGLCDANPLLDVYLLGATLYQLCTQLLPKLTGLRPIHEVNPSSEAPEDFSRLLRSALEPEPSDRLPSADHLRRGLEAILAAHPQTSRRDLFGGSFDRLEVIGVGASAVVFRASDRWLSREVALKVLRDAKPSEDDAIRFHRAAKILSALRHPNIPQIHHYGIEGREAFTITELCPGSPATDVAGPDKHLRSDEVIAVGRQLASALMAVHAVDVVYRDLHAGNVLIARGEKPQAWIFDFDHAQVSPAFYAHLTERWATPPEARAEPKSEKPLRNMDYAAPEVRSGGAFTVASDVFALGLMLYRLLTGLRPFPPGGSEPVPARKVCPECPPGLESLLIAMVNPSPSGRPNLQAVEEALAAQEEELEAVKREEAEAEQEAAAAAPTVPIAQVVLSATPESAPVTSVDAVERPTPSQATTAAAEAPPVDLPIGTSRVTPIARRGGMWGLLALIFAVAVGVVVGRVTAPGDIAVQLAGDMQGTQAQVMPSPTPPRTSTDDGPTKPATAEVAPMKSPHEGTPPKPAQTTDTTGKRTPPLRRTQPSPRGAVTTAEATAAAQGAVQALRGCKDVPGAITADLDVVRGKGAVVTLNARAPAPDDPRYPWHACARDALERVRFPVSEIVGRVRVRLPLE